jgi:hypothetical protein
MRDFRFPSEGVHMAVTLLTRILELLLSNLGHDRILLVFLSPSSYMPGFGCAHIQVLSKSPTDPFGVG